MSEDPAHCRRTRHRAHGLGQTNGLITPHPLYIGPSDDAATRQKACRDLFRAHLEQAARDDIRPALNQNQPLGENRFGNPRCQV